MRFPSRKSVPQKRKRTRPRGAGDEKPPGFFIALEETRVSLKFCVLSGRLAD
jgi:hypothetical protein